MATYQNLGSTQTAVLNDGTKLGFVNPISASINGKSLAGGSGCVRFKSLDDGKTYSFQHGETISVP